MADLSEDKINKILENVIDVYTGDNIVAAKLIDEITIDNDKIGIKITLGYPAKSYIKSLKDEIKNTLAANSINNVSVDINSIISPHSVQKGVEPLNEVKNIIAIASGKGGVGKSTIALNLALALQEEGAKAAILDADIYGPSQPRMLGLSSQKPEASKEGKLLPILGHGMQSMSIGYLVDEDSPMIWRGPMVTQALEQLLRDTLWRGVDYLIIDLPPGTGDTQLTLAQKIPVSGSVIITTPQDIALIDAKKGLKMFEKVSIPILGIVENMSIHICSKCGNEDAIFGTGGGENMAKSLGTNFLGALPLDTEIRSCSDKGTPIVVQKPDSRIAKIYTEVALKMSAKLAQSTKDFTNKFPSITVE